MDDTSARVDYLIQLRKRGIITDRELATGFAFEIAVFEQAEQVMQFSKELPTAAIVELLAFLDEQRRAGFNWKPLLIGPGYSDDSLELELIRQQTRRMADLLLDR